MKKNIWKLTGIIAIGVVIGFGLAGCDNGSGVGGGGITTPEVINGFYGVTSDGKTIEIVITPKSSNSTLFSKSAVSRWTTGDDYFVYIDRVKVSGGTITVTAENDSITFVSNDGSSVSSITTTAPGNITITPNGGTAYSGKVVAAEDHYYCIGAATDASKAEILSVFSGKTPEEVYRWCSTYGTSMFLDYPESKAGTWNEIVLWGKGYGAPDYVISGMAEELKGKVSAVGWYRWASEGYNIMFYISRVPLQAGQYSQSL
jgi:hypothetical protein